jgi:glutaredoxin
MSKIIKVYTSVKCKYCDKLKDGLDNLGLEYIDINVDAPENDNEVTKIYQFAGEPIIPIITIQPHVLVPKRSFKTIEEALKLIQSLME